MHVYGCNPRGEPDQNSRDSWSKANNPREILTSALVNLINSHRDLASNLVGVANQGQNAFIEAYGDMLQTASKTNNMGRVGGIVKFSF